MKNLGSLVILSLVFQLITGPLVLAKAKTTTTSSSKPSGYAPVQESYYSGFEYELQTALSTGGIKSYKAGNNTVTLLEANMSLSKLIKNNIQAGGEVHIYNTSGAGSSSYFEFMGFGVYNFDNDLKQSLYAKAGLGMLNTINDRGGNDSKLGILIGGGKRILVLDKFTYTPEGRIILVDGTTRIELILLNFSLLF